MRAASLSIAAIGLFWMTVQPSFAEPSIIGCWNNYEKRLVATAPRKDAPQILADVGFAVCFRKDGQVDAAHFSGIEGLGSGGEFRVSKGRVKIIRGMPGDGWPFGKKISCRFSFLEGDLILDDCRPPKELLDPFRLKRQEGRSALDF